MCLGSVWGFIDLFLQSSAAPWWSVDVHAFFESSRTQKSLKLKHENENNDGLSSK